MQLLTPQHWKEYELIDSGNFEKLERFGKYILIRPEPQAVWNKRLDQDEWEKVHHARYTREKGKNDLVLNTEKGNWQKKSGMPESWFIEYENNGLQIQMRLALTSFGHIGIFPEQAINWDYIYEKVKLLPKDAPVLNLFAYTGGASLAAKAAGADVVHVDSIKQTVSWSKTNMDKSELKDIRWVVEDAMKFVKREVKRGKKYQGIIMDPPAYGRGPAGEKWILEQNINEMIELTHQLLEDENSFMVINLYSMGLSALVVETLISSYFNLKDPEFGEFYLRSSTGQKLPLGTFLRFTQ